MLRIPTALLLSVFALTAIARAAEPLAFEVDGAKKYEISPLIYGHNFPDYKTMTGATTIVRWGGNRTTAYNWENNASNAGNDWQHQSDNYVVRDLPLDAQDKAGEAVRVVVAKAHQAGAAVVVTVPTVGHVAADKAAGGDVNKTPDYLNKRFKVSMAAKGAPFVYPPDTTDDKVYQDEFVAWLEKTFPDARKDTAKQLIYSLDNEPDLWSSTHARIHPGKLTFSELVKNNIEYATAIKAVAPKAQVSGFCSYGWNGFMTLQNAPDGKGRNFLDFYLDEMKKAEESAGKRLIDIVDLHWYPEAQGKNDAGQMVRITLGANDKSAGVAAARVQAPRSLWDPTYVEQSWIATGPLAGKPIRLIPMVREKIEKHYPGTKLAFFEYDYGGGETISGALAEADALGIFGREGLYAATYWGETPPFLVGGMLAYRNYDGKGAAFGTTGLAATQPDPALASLYASQNAAGKLVLVAINKTTDALPIRIALKNCPATTSIAIYRITEKNPTPALVPDAGAVKTPLELELPALSISTIVLSSGN